MSASDPQPLTLRHVKRVALVLVASLAVGLALVVGKAARVHAAIRRITDTGGLVLSFADPPAIDLLGYGRLQSEFWQLYPMREHYDVAFRGATLGYCGVGISFFAEPDARGDPGDTRLAVLRGLPAYRSVDLQDTSVSDAGLVALRGLDIRSSLDLGGTLVRGPGLANLDSPRLALLSLARTEVDDDGLAYLDHLPALWWLDVGRTRVTGAAFAKLARYPNLRALIVNHTRVGDAALAGLAGLPLERVDLSETDVTDAAIPQLERLGGLEYVSLCATRVTREALARSTSAALRTAAHAPCMKP